MQLFLDTTNLDAIKKYTAMGIVDGVTTNPTLLAKQGVPLEKTIKEILKIVNGPISAETVELTAEKMIADGRRFSRWHRNVYTKLPMTEEGLKALKVLSKEGIKTNVTLIFSPSQALLAAKLGATLVSPFVGRLDDISENGMQLIADIVQIFKNYNFHSKVLVASVRHPLHVIEAAKLGADICTIPPEVMEKLIHHPLTDKGVEQFLKDHNQTK